MKRQKKFIHAQSSTAPAAPSTPAPQAQTLPAWMQGLEGAKRTYAPGGGEAQEESNTEQNFAPMEAYNNSLQKSKSLFYERGYDEKTQQSAINLLLAAGMTNPKSASDFLNSTLSEGQLMGLGALSCTEFAVAAAKKAMGNASTAKGIVDAVFHFQHDLRDPKSSIVKAAIDAMSGSLDPRTALSLEMEIMGVNSEIGKGLDEGQQLRMLLSELGSAQSADLGKTIYELNSNLARSRQQMFNLGVGFEIFRMKWASQAEKALAETLKGLNAKLGPMLYQGWGEQLARVSETVIQNYFLWKTWTSMAQFQSQADMMRDRSPQVSPGFAGQQSNYSAPSTTPTPGGTGRGAASEAAREVLAQAAPNIGPAPTMQTPVQSANPFSTTPLQSQYAPNSTQGQNFQNFQNVSKDIANSVTQMNQGQYPNQANYLDTLNFNAASDPLYASLNSGGELGYLLTNFPVAFDRKYKSIETRLAGPAAMPGAQNSGQAPAPNMTPEQVSQAGSELIAIVDQARTMFTTLLAKYKTLRAEVKSSTPQAKQSVASLDAAMQQVRTDIENKRNTATSVKIAWVAEQKANQEVFKRQSVLTPGMKEADILRGIGSPQIIKAFYDSKLRVSRFFEEASEAYSQLSRNVSSSGSPMDQDYANQAESAAQTYKAKAEQEKTDADGLLMGSIGMMPGGSSATEPGISSVGRGANVHHSKFKRFAGDPEEDKEESDMDDADEDRHDSDSNDREADEEIEKYYNDLYQNDPPYGTALEHPERERGIPTTKILPHASSIYRKKASEIIEEADKELQDYYNDLIPGYGDALEEPWKHEHETTDEIDRKKHHPKKHTKHKFKHVSE